MTATEFDENVVEVATAPVHGYFYTCLGQRCDPHRSGELGTLIRIHDLGWAIFGDGFVQDFLAKARIHRV